jgi:hypothetical protein
MALRKLLPVFTVALLGLCAHSISAQQSVLTCSSDNGKRNYCAADTRGGVSMGRQRSGSPCIEGQTWGYDSRGIWVDRGCRADFIVRSYRPGRPGGPGYGPGNRPGGPGYGPGGSGQIITCSSEDGRRNYCSANTRRGVTLVKQRSGSPCVQGQTWGYDSRGIWVDRGCRADFRVR